MNPIARAWHAINVWWLGNYIAGNGPPVPSSEWSVCGEGISPQAAASVPAVLRCCALYADMVASLPRGIVRRADNAAIERDTTSDSARALAATTYADWEGAVLDCCLRGNGYLEVPRNDRGGVLPLEWIPAQRVTLGFDDRRRLFYRIAADYTLQERERVIPAANVVHLRFRMTGESRYLGVSPAMTCAPSLALAIDARQLQRELLVNLCVPGFVLSATGKLNPDAMVRLETKWQEHFGRSRTGRGRTAVVDQGLKPEGVPLPDAVKGQMIETFRYGVEEVGRMYGVPGVLLDEAGGQTSANAAEALRAFAGASLRPFCDRIADELTRKVVNDGSWRAEFDLRSLLQTPAEEADRTVRYLNAGALSLNEVRAGLGLAPVTGGDAIRAPVNVQPLPLWLAGGPKQEQQPGNDDVPVSDADPDSGESAQERTLRVVS